MTTVAPTDDVDYEAWARAARQHIEATVVTGEARSALAEAGIDDLDHAEAFDLYAYLQIIHAPGIELRMPEPPNVPSWAVSTDVRLGTAGEGFILHQGQQHGGDAFGVHIETSIAIQIYPELSNEPVDRIGTHAADGPTLCWDAHVTKGGSATAEDAAKFAIALAAAAAELEQLRSTAVER